VCIPNNCVAHFARACSDKFPTCLAFVNSERWLAKSRVDITQCQYGNVGKFLSLYFFVLYYKTNIKHFFCIDIQLYQYSWKLGELEFVFPISTRVDITVYKHGKCFIFVTYKILNCYYRIHLWKRGEGLLHACISSIMLLEIFNFKRKRQ
jgi:hypothetical protein